MANQTQRRIPDAAVMVFTNHAAQNTTTGSASIDLVLAGNVSRESLEVLVSLDAAPSLANGQTIAVKLQDSADDITFTDIASLASSTAQTGAGGVGAVAVSKRWALPSTVRQYIRVYETMSATTGDNTAVGTTFQLVF
jgi:hypothetical protein